MKTPSYAPHVFFLRASGALACMALATAINVQPLFAAPPAQLMSTSARIALGADTTPGDDDSLFRISAPGHYYLAGHVTGVAGKYGIEIAADDVTIDLNGFTLTGVPGSLAGISAATNSNLGHRLSVRNGTIRGWKAGILHNRNEVRFSHLYAIGNQGSGLRAGDQAIITDCHAIGNASEGVLVASHASLTRVYVRQNENGVRAALGSRLTDCSAVENKNIGFSLSGYGHTVVGCTAVGNHNSNGFDIDYYSTVERCTARDNGRHGFYIGQGGTISNCASAFNDAHGFNLEVGSVATNCAANGNVLDGFACDGGNQIETCTAVLNGRNGFLLRMYSLIRGCLARQNGLHGIAAEGSCHVQGSHSVFNGRTSNTGAGIHAAGAANHIEGNTCTSNDVGFSIVSGDNFVIRNSARGNSLNFNFAAGVEYGQVINNPGAGFNLANSWANIGY